MTTATTAPWPQPDPSTDAWLAAADYFGRIPASWVPLPPPAPGTRVGTLHRLDRPPMMASNPMALIAAKLEAERANIRRRDEPRTWPKLALVVLTLVAFLYGLMTGVFVGRASALPLCGGNQNIQTVPVTCTNQRTIDGTTITVVLDVATDGTITATYTLSAPRQVDTPIRVRSHRGISSSPDVLEASAVIPAGATTAVLQTRLNCGQIDVKAVFTGNGDARGRVAAPFVTKPGDCLTATNTTTTTTTVVTTTTSGGSTTTSATTSSTPGEATSTRPPSAVTLPATGGGPGVRVGYAIAIALVVGIVVIVATRRRDGWRTQ